MRISSRIPLVLTVVLAAIGFGTPARGTLMSGVHAQHARAAAPAGAAYAVSMSSVFAVVVTVNPSPTAVGLLTTVTIATAPNAACTLSIRLPDQTTVQQNVASGTADSGGNLTLQFTTGYNMVGSDQATVICAEAGQTGTGFVTFSVLPPPTTPTPTPVFTAPGAERVATQPTTPLAPGSIFSILGEGFAPGATISVNFILGNTYSAVVGPYGTFTIANIMVPYGQHAGIYNLVLQNSSNPFDHVVVSIAIQALAPAIALDTTSAAHGDTVGVSGSGFGANEVVDVTFGPNVLFTVAADNSGDFSGTFTVPADLPYGTFDVDALGESTGLIAIAPLAISLLSPFAPTSTVTATATPIPPTATPGPPTYTPTVTPVPLGPTRASFFFAEGTTAGGEQVGYNVLNTGTTPAHVMLMLVFADGTVINHAVLAPAQALSQIAINALIGPAEQGKAFSTEVTADQPVSVARTVARPGHEGTLSDGTTANFHYQYFAEGYTGRGFQERLALFNSANSNANVELLLLPAADGSPLIRRYIVGPLRRYTIDVNALAPRRSVGAIVVSDTELSVERTLTFGASGNGQTTVSGVDAPQTTWYFAEGSTKNGFSEFITLLNPADAPATTTADFYDTAGKRIGSKTLVVAAHKRATIDVGTVVRATSVGTIVTSSAPVVAERSMYRGSLTGASVIGSGSFGQSTLSPVYEIPSGDTSPGNAEFLLLLNPNPAPLAVQLRFYTTSGAGPTFPVVVPAHARITIDVTSQVPGLPQGLHGVVVSSVDGTPFVAEQSEYLHNFTSAWSSTGIGRSATNS